MAAVADLVHQVSNRIGGELRSASNAATFERRDPARPDRVVSVAPESTAEDVADAVGAAVEAAASWRRSTPSTRSKLLRAAAAVLRERAPAIAEEMVAEQGKPLSAARGEAGRTPENLELYASEALRLTGCAFPTDDVGAQVRGELEPVGVVGVITPWNFPLNLASRKIGPALAAGNTVVFKPSPLTPLMGERLAAAFEDAGFPPGVVNVVHGGEAGRLLVADERVNAITFTGSTATGRAIQAATPVGRRLQLELGGNNPIIVLGDADLDAAAKVIATSSFSLSGQACTGAGRVLADDAIYEPLLDRVVDLAAKEVVGPGTDPDSTMGPLVAQRALEDVHAAVQRTVADGATLTSGGSPFGHDGPPGDGWFYPPTILAEVAETAYAATHEVFGPVIGFERVSDLDEAIRRANDTEYGLTAAICTRDPGAARRFAAEVTAGMLKINRPTVGAAINLPFGGFKASGTGTHKEQSGPTVMDFYTRMRVVVDGGYGEA